MQRQQLAFGVCPSDRRKRWLCIACTAGNVECRHRTAAENAAAAHESQDEDDSYDPYSPPSDSEDEEQGQDGAAAGQGGDATSSVGKPGGTSAAAPDEILQVINPRGIATRFSLRRDLVPPDQEQIMRQRSSAMAATGGPPIEVVPPTICRFCRTGPGKQTKLKKNHCRIEFDDGAADTTVCTWKCPSCKYKHMSDGQELGLVFHSPNTAYSEAFLFELSVNLSRQGCALQASACLREGFQELNGGHKYRADALRLRSVMTLRKATVLYINLVIKYLPPDVTTCATCRDKDGSIPVLFF